MSSTDIQSKQTNNESFNELPKSFPKVLYKYRYFDKKNYHLSILTHNEIIFASPGSFNDPFDCHIPPRYDLGTKVQIIKIIKQYLIRKNPNINSKKVNCEAKRLYKTNRTSLIRNRDFVKNYTDDVANISLGIFCLSANNSSILSWSHYSDSHKGFCIGFDSNILIQFCVDKIQELKNILYFKEVIYLQELPIINRYANDYNKQIINGFLAKSKEWEYENEYRMILQDGQGEKLHLPDNAIRRVIIGCQMNEDNQKELIDIVKARNNKVSVFKAKPSMDEFKLVFKKVGIY